jgi:AcrR family transcriptional regulator
MKDKPMVRAAQTASRSTRRSPRARQDELLDEAARQFNARGVTLTSLTELADSVGISRATLYYYIDDREDLVFKVYRRSLEVLARHLGEAARSGRQALDVVDQFITGALDPSQPEIAALSEIGLLRGPERETIWALYEGVAARLASVLEAGHRTSEVRASDYEVAARCIISLIHWVPLAERWNSVETRDRDAIVNLTCQLVRIGVATRRVVPERIVEIDISPLLSSAIVAFDQDGLRDAKREAILRVASRLFNTKGIDTTSLDEIAAALRTNKRALYRSIGDKQAIITACYQRAFRMSFFISDQAMALGLSAADQLDAQQRTHALVQQNRELCPLRHVSGLDALPDDSRTEVLAMAHRFTNNNRECVKRAQADGDFRDIDVEDFLNLGAGPSAWLSKPLVEPSPARQAIIAAEIADFVRLGLAPLAAR